MEIFAPPGMEELTQQIQGMFQNLGSGKRRTRKLKIRDALKAITDEEAARLINDEEVKAAALKNVEQNGIVFLDEIDKIATRSEAHGADVSRQGVQRDLLPLVEGTTVSTKYGMIKTDHILFIASGAFHLAKPSDLIPELQGRLPIRVELDSLSVDDFERILTQTDACLTRQYQALLGTEKVTLEFTDDGIRRLAEIAFEVNEKTENIGARRLYTVMEKLLEEVSFDAGSQRRRGGDGRCRLCRSTPGRACARRGSVALRSLMRRAAALLLLAFAAGLAQAADIEVKTPWTRATVRLLKVGSAYMEIRSAQEATLVGASSPVAGNVELHEMRMEGDLMKMRAVPRLPLPAGKVVRLAPGGYHLMLYDLKQQLLVGTQVPIRLEFETSRGRHETVEVSAEVRPLR